MANDYKVLYRKYRPKSFDEVVGQKYTIEMLKNAVITNKISHAYIFTGPRGTGKTSTAKIFAKTINCENPKSGIPCGTCSSCQNIQNSADIIEIDAASNNGVDAIRELINNVKIAPSFSKYKVYIIDEVHMLSQSAFNALLLTLEEPPSHIVFIMATTNIESVPITILSRCQRYDFKKLNDEELFEHLKKVSDLEKINITDEAIKEITYLADGGCRDALSILNQLSTSNNEINLETVLKNYGSVSIIQVQNIVKYYLKSNYESLKECFFSIDSSSIDYKVFLKKIIDKLFDEAITFKSKGKNNEYLMIKDTIFELNDCLNKININIDPFMLIFLILIKNIQVENSDTSNVTKIENSNENKIEIINEENTSKIDIIIEEKQDNSDNKKEYLEYIKKLKSVRINNCFAKADKTVLLENKEKWLDFNRKISVKNKLKPIIIDNTVVLSSNEISILIDSQESIVNMFNMNLKEIEDEYEEKIGIKMKFIALTNDEWEKYKKEYIKKLKEKYVYQIMVEPSYQHDIKENIEEPLKSTSDSNEVLNIFNNDHVEIK